MKLTKQILSGLFLLFNWITLVVGKGGHAAPVHSHPKPSGHGGLIADFFVATFAGLATNYLWYEAEKKFGLGTEESDSSNNDGGVVISVKRDEQIDAGISMINGLLMMCLNKFYARDYKMQYIAGMGSRITFRFPLKSMKFPRVCPYELSHKPECQE